MIRTTYKGRDIKILKSSTPGCVKTHIGGTIISHGFQGTDANAFDWFRAMIDRIDRSGPGSNSHETGAHWYASGTFDTNAFGHVIAPGGACCCNTCLASPERNVSRAEAGSCQHCHLTDRDHGRQYTDLIGWHQWTAPTPEQTKGRMRARRNAEKGSA
jgi:hypothetical protein